MQDIKDSLGEVITIRAQEMVAADAKTFGDPTTLLAHKGRMVEIIIKIAGVDKGAPVSPAFIAALDAGAAIVGFLNAKDPSEALARFIAAGVAAAPITGFIQARDAMERKDTEETRKIADKFGHKTKAEG